MDELRAGQVWTLWGSSELRGRLTSCGLANHRTGVLQIMPAITVNPARRVGEVDPRLFGGFIEHLGRCIYGGVFDEGSPLADEHGFRTDVLEAARPLRMPLVRWPGGNFVSGYHWTDGIGPVDDRPRRMELAWHAEESNRFGTDEFMAWCKKLGTEPYLCLNMGTGTLDEAQAWLEYCNGTGSTYWADRRRANGHDEPYRVRYWGLGNEIYGDWQIGHRTAENYVETARQWAHVLRLTDPEIQLVSCGLDGLSEWDRIVIDGLASVVDFHSIHIYTGSDDYWTDLLSPLQAERALRAAGGMLERARYHQHLQRRVYVAYDEWNVWFRARDNSLEERYNLADALAVATYLNVFVRQCQIVRLANLAQLVNVIPPIVTSPDGLFLQTIYHPLRLYAEQSLPVAVDTFVETDTRDYQPPAGEADRLRLGDLGPVPLLDVASTVDPDHARLCVAVVNRDPHRPARTTLQVTDGQLADVVAYEVNGPDPAVSNSFEQPDVVGVRTRQVEHRGSGPLQVELAPHSFTMLVGELRP